MKDIMKDILKTLKSKHICVVNAGKRKVYDFDKGKQVKRAKNKWPVFGFICNVCLMAATNTNLYLLGGITMCEECALKKTLKQKEC